MPDFLLEIGCEEIPARMIDAASRELQERLSALLQRERLEPAGVISHLDSPRRLAVLASGIPASQPDLTEQVNGPSAQIAYKDGQPTPAAHAFAKKVGVDVAKLEKISTPKGEYLAATVTRRGRTAAEILAETLPKEIATLYWPKNMYWRKRGEVFVRPVRWLLAMLDEQVVPLELFGIAAGKTSRGHRIISSGSVAIPKPGAYIETLRSAKVLGATEREQVIRKALDAATRTIPGARWREDKPLVATVVNLTEFPSAILGSFDPEFLDLPEEALADGQLPYSLSTRWSAHPRARPASRSASERRLRTSRGLPAAPGWSASCTSEDWCHTGARATWRAASRSSGYCSPACLARWRCEPRS